MKQHYEVKFIMCENWQALLQSCVGNLTYRVDAILKWRIHCSGPDFTRVSYLHRTKVSRCDSYLELCTGVCVEVTHDLDRLYVLYRGVRVDCNL